MREMKSSEALFLDVVPSEWELKRTKFIAEMLYKGNGITKEDIDENGDTPCIRYGEIYSSYNQSFQECCSKTNIDTVNSPRYFRKNDVLFACTGELINEIGKSVVYLGDDNCLAGGDIIVMRHSQEPRFINYLMNCAYVQAQKSHDKYKLKVVHISASSIGDLKVYIPSLTEQRRIADYLDAKCSAIDEAIVKHKGIIEKLEEYRTEVISNEILGLRHNDVVETGIDWMSKMSASRKAWRLKYLVKEPLKYGANESGIPYDETLPRYIRITDISNDGGLKNTGKLSLSEEQASKYILEDGAILFARSGATVGKTFLYRESYGRSAFAGYLISAVPNTKLLVSGWLKYYTESIPYKNWKDMIFTQATIQNIGADKYSELIVPICSIEEQTSVVSKLDEISVQITKMTESQRSIITKLEEYRKSIIYNAVTGKIDCRKEG